MIPEGPAPFRGVYAATPAPLTSAFALDEPSLRALLAELAAGPGLAGLLVNGHAGENPSMPLADQCRVVEIAARRADGWNAAFVNPEEYRRLNGVLDHWCEVNRRDPLDIRRGANVAFALSMSDAGAKAERGRLRALENGQRLDDGALTGTPDAAVEQVMEYVEAGAQDVNVLLQPPWDAEALDAYLDDVIPAIHKESGRAK